MCTEVLLISNEIPQTKGRYCIWKKIQNINKYENNFVITLISNDHNLEHKMLYHLIFKILIPSLSPYDIINIYDLFFQ